MRPAIVVMSRVPLPGETKTRLMSKLSGEECADLHLACLKDIFTTISEADVQGYVYFTDNTNMEIPSCLIKRLQRGKDLGERIYNAALEVLASHDKIIFLGADLPDITINLLEHALNMVNKYDVVIGPAIDGGYYLLGIKESYQQLFLDIEWGSPRVLEQTLKHIRNSNLSFCMLERKGDIDNWNDLVSFYTRIQSNDIEHKRLRTFDIAKVLVHKYISI